jgi:hypothetical protein
MTLVELLVATAAGVIVMFGVTTSVIVTTRESNRVATHVNADQRARIAMTRIIDQLHSSCVAPLIVPVRSGSTGTMLILWHQTGSAVAPAPIESKISLSGTTLSQTNYQGTGTGPNWTFPTTATSTVELMTGVSQISSSTPIFRYYAYSNGQISSTPLSTPLTEESAPTAVQVTVAFKAAPQKTPFSDSNASTSIEDSAQLRLTSPGYGTSSVNQPCQ